ncbi:DUF4190 domain-containing protein [Cryobacterium arcticum]|uniref:DUF4190 domain-containing protein n=1 Tax=Cryobacterium arcticum TaxID=670052 RepID=A0A317ZX47_9MICO|nr:DUF4190 domain-containing protein [Cryobacterium arcticum]PXA71953.1 hypothetical protein CTB96_03295 [Cryobacterium arcticum]
MGTYPITIVVVLAAAIGAIFLLRFGIKQNAAAQKVTPPPGATSLLAILSLVAAIIVAPIGVVLAHIALSRIAAGEASGRRFAWAALWIGYVLIVVELAAIVVIYQNQYWM